MFKSISNTELYNHISLSFIFEFFTPINKREVSAKFARALGKKVKWFTDSKNGFKPTNESFKLEPTYSNKYKSVKLSTGFIPYHEAMHMFLKINNVIESVGHTTNRCGVKTKIRLNEFGLGLAANTDRLNKLKYLIGLDEKKIFELWPSVNNESQKIYQNQLAFIQPKNPFSSIISESYVERMHPHDFIVPESEFFGNDFSELGEGSLIINYIGGKDYTKKKKNAVSTINLIIEHLYNTLLKNNEYTVDERRKVSDMVTEFKNSVESTKTYLGFKTKYPDISLYVDLKKIDYIIEANYPIIREKIFRLISSNAISECVINYDTYRRAIQIKDAKIGKSIVVEGIEFYQSEIEADAKGCLFENCEIKNSKLTECTIFSNNNVKFSKIINCDYLGESNDIEFSYLDNSPTKMINANLKECLVNHGKFTLNSNVDDSTKIINII
jgi:hypothetical protein